MSKEWYEADECCGKCCKHKFDDESQDWVCTNSKSEYFAEWTNYNDACEEFKGRDTQ